MRRNGILVYLADFKIDYKNFWNRGKDTGNNNQIDVKSNINESSNPSLQSFSQTKTKLNLSRSITL